MRYVLITGGAGFIGSNFVHYLLNADAAVTIVNLDALTYAGSLLNLEGIPDDQRHIFVQGNICDERLVDELFRTYRIDTIVHFAAESHVDRSILEPSPFVQTNVIGTFTLLEAARQLLAGRGRPGQLRRFAFTTSPPMRSSVPCARVSPPFQRPPATRRTRPMPPAKLQRPPGARLRPHLRAAIHHHQLLQQLRSVTSSRKNSSRLMILNALRGNPLPVYGDGQQVRDWLYVEDHCEAILTILQKGKPGETYNMGGGQPAR